MTRSAPSAPPARAATPAIRARSTRRRLILGAGLAAFTVIGAACTGNPAASSSASRPTSAPPASSPASVPPASVSAPSTGPSAGAASVLAITAKDYSFELPATTPAGPTTITVTNQGKEGHQAQLVRLADATTMAQLTTALKNPDPSAALKLVTLAGGPTNVVPGATVSTASNLKAGQYAFLCFFRTADGTPHIAKGMIAGIQVTGSETAGQLPAGDTTVVAKDFGYEVPTAPLATGKHTVTFTNNGPSPHEAGLVKLADGMTVDKIKQIMASGTPPSGPPPWTAVAGTAGVSPGSTTTFDIDVTAGNYAFICFIPDPATGKSHFDLGMIAPLTVQ